MDEKMDMTSGALTYSRSLSLLKEVNIQCDALKEKTTSLKKLLQEAKEAEHAMNVLGAALWTTFARNGRAKEPSSVLAKSHSKRI